MTMDTVSYSASLQIAQNQTLKIVYTSPDALKWGKKIGVAEDLRPSGLM